MKKFHKVLITATILPDFTWRFVKIPTILRVENAEIISKGDTADMILLWDGDDKSKARLCQAVIQETPEEDTPKVEVFITKKGKFRAKVSLPQESKCYSSSYEVTVGGKEWKKGKGSELKDIIKAKVLKMYAMVYEEINSIY